MTAESIAKVLGEAKGALGIDQMEKERRPVGLVNSSGEWPNAAGSLGQKERKDFDRRTETDDGERISSQGLGIHETEHGLRRIACSGHYRISARQRNHIRATRVATLDELAKAIGALDEDIGRRVRGAPALIFTYLDVERLRQDKAALVELQKRCGRSGCPGSTTVIESLFPDVPVKKKTASEKAEIEAWLGTRKEAGLKIDPESPEVDWSYGQTLDPYGVLDEWELPEEFHQVGREYFARSPGSDVWVDFGDLPEATRERLWKRHSRKLAFPAGLEGMPIKADEDPDVPF